MIRFALPFFLASALSLPAGALAASDADDGERAQIRKLTDALLQRFIDARPRLRPEVKAAAGYALFTTYGGNLLGTPGGGGKGVGLAVEKGGARETFMGMQQTGADGRANVEREMLIVFSSPGAVEAFARKGWKAQPGAEVLPEATVYTLTGSGVEVGTPLAGARFWNNAALN